MNGPNIPGWTRHEICPITPGCTAKVVWVDADGTVWRLNPKTRNDFVIHQCQVKGSNKPQIAYLGEWYNERTGRTRWTGPERLETSARKPPATSGNRNEWIFIRVHTSPLKWEPKK